MAKTKDPKADRHQVILAEMLKEEDNKYCADCAMKGKQNRVRLITGGIKKTLYISKTLQCLLVHFSTGQRLAFMS